MKIGDVIHSVRREKGMTLADLSKKSDVALATLSRIENGKMTGTLESHINICKALDITLADLYRDLPAAHKVVEIQSKRSRSEVFVHDKRSAAEMLASNILGKKMMPLLIKIQAGGATHVEETKTGIEKFIYVVSGKVEATVGAQKFALGKGDTLYFEASLPHYFKNTGREESHIICVTSPPTL